MESSRDVEQHESLLGGADVVQGTSLCSPDNSVGINKHVEDILAVIQEQGRHKGHSMDGQFTYDLTFNSEGYSMNSQFTCNLTVEY